MALAGGQIIMPWGEKTLPEGSLNFGSSHGALAFGFAFTQALASATISPAGATSCTRTIFFTAADQHAIDRGGHRFAARLETAVDERHLFRPVDEGAHRRLLAFGLGAARGLLARGL